MRRGMVFRSVRPYVSAVAVLITAALLIAAIYFNEFDLPWIAFLTGVLAAAVLAMASRASRAEWILTRREAKVASLQEKLGSETRLHHEAEDRLAASDLKLELLEDVLPVMAIFVDGDGQVRFHNRAFRDWLGLRAEHIDGRPLRDVLGAKTFGELAAAVGKALAGQTQAFEQAYTMLDGKRQNFHVRYLPHRGDDGKVDGFFALQFDLPGKNPDLAVTTPLAPHPTPAVPACPEQDLFIESLSEEVAGADDAVSRIMAAIEQNEFRLYCQRIVPLAAGAGSPEHREVLVRLIEEEECLMPPGAFFPLVEKHGLMPQLDRWVVQHVLEWVASRGPAQAHPAGSSFFINLAVPTLGDADFPEFVRDQLLAYGVPPAVLCFEIGEAALSHQNKEVVDFSERLRELGCKLALSGFGHDRVSFESLRGFKTDFLKIDGNIVLNVVRSPTDLAKMVAIIRVAKTIGIQTIAELAESEECVLKLGGIGVDFAQGFAISVPKSLAG